MATAKHDQVALRLIIVVCQRSLFCLYGKQLSNAVVLKLDKCYQLLLKIGIIRVDCCHRFLSHNFNDQQVNVLQLNDLGDSSLLMGLLAPFSVLFFVYIVIVATSINFQYLQKALY